MSRIRRAAFLPLLAAAGLLLAACATSTPGDDPGPGGGTNDPVAPFDVVGQGTVFQVGDAAPELCLGAIAESYPPQCFGARVPLLEWDWSRYDGSETAAGVGLRAPACDGEALRVGRGSETARRLAE